MQHAKGNTNALQVVPGVGTCDIERWTGGAGQGAVWRLWDAYAAERQTVPSNLALMTHAARSAASAKQCQVAVVVPCNFSLHLIWIFRPVTVGTAAKTERQFS